MSGLERPQRGLSRHGGETAGEEFPALAQSFLVDPVADALRQMPLDGHAEGAKTARGMKQRLRRNEVVAIPVDQQDWRTRLDLGRNILRSRLRRLRQQPGIADNRERRGGAAQTYM